MRAGGPSAVDWIAEHVVALPRARGWTVHREVQDLGVGGSSACARVDPFGLVWPILGAWLFRVRAGGPIVLDNMNAALEAFPRARG